MNTTQTEISRLATALVTGLWSEEEMLLRVQPFVNGSNRWMLSFVRRVRQQFGKLPPRRRQLMEFIARDAAFRKKYRENSLCFDVPLPPVLFQPQIERFETLDVLRLHTVGDLSRWLQLSDAELHWFADRRRLERVAREGPLRHYRYYWIRKRRSQARLIEAPKPRMREIQQLLLQHVLLQHVLDPIPLHPAAHGFCRNRSIGTHALPHVGRAVVLRMDLKDFFPSIPVTILLRLLMTVGYSEEVAMTLISLCTNSAPADVFSKFPWPDDRLQLKTASQLYQQSHFPQGAPTSPAVANLCAFRLDCRLSKLAEHAGATYTRYADDLLFSGDHEFRRGVERFRIVVAAIAMDEGFIVNHHKTQVMTQSVRQHAVGLVLNEKLNIGRKAYDQLKAILHRAAQNGPDAENRMQRDNFRARKCSDSFSNRKE